MSRDRPQDRPVVPPGPYDDAVIRALAAALGADEEVSSRTGRRWAWTTERRRSSWWRRGGRGRTRRQRRRAGD